MNTRPSSALALLSFSIAYAAMNFVVAFIAVTPIFSIAYAAMNHATNCTLIYCHFSIAYAAMNSRILAEC